METDIVKIVYFDEGSATDFCQMQSGGALSIESSENRNKDSKVSGDISARFSAKLSELLPFVKASAEANGSAEGSYHVESMVKSIVTNTVLTDFLETVELQEVEKQSIVQFDKRKIEQVPGSLSALTLLTPYLDMLCAGQGVSAGDFDISIDRLGSALAKAKGYLEFIGRERRKADVVFRFNAAAFKNNYRPSDLLRMNLKLYAVQVGTCRISDLLPDSELNVRGFDERYDNPDYCAIGKKPKTYRDSTRKVFDVILAGVKTNG